MRTVQARNGLTSYAAATAAGCLSILVFGGGLGGGYFGGLFVVDASSVIFGIASGQVNLSSRFVGTAQISLYSPPRMLETHL